MVSIVSVIVREMQTQTAMRCHLTTLRMPVSETPQVTNVGEDVEKGSPRAPWVGTHTAAAVDSHAKVSCRTRIRTAMWLSSATPGQYLKVTETLILKE